MRLKASGWLRRTFALWLLLALAFFAPVQAADGLVPVPPLQARLTDLSATLSPAELSSLEQTLRAFEARKGTQIAVLIVATTKPEEIEQYALRVVEQWKLGRKQVDDGALLLIAKEDRALRIEVGYGIEGALNDATAKRIVSEVIAPKLSEGDYYAGISAGVEQMMRVIDGEALPAPKPGAPGTAPDGSSESFEHVLPFLFVLAFWVGSLLRALLGRVPGALATGGLLALTGWLLGAAIATVLIGGVIAFLIALFGLGAGGRGGMPGGYYGTTRGGGGFSGGGGSGFSGGGGSFGGGGASGRF